MRVYQCRGVAVLTLHMNECSTSKYCISTSQFKLQKAMRYQVSSLVINEFAKAFVSPLLRWYSSGDLSGMISWAALGHPVPPEPMKVGQNILTIPPHHHSCSRGPRWRLESPPDWTKFLKLKKKRTGRDVLQFSFWWRNLLKEPEWRKWLAMWLGCKSQPLDGPGIKSLERSTDT